jgi:prevent-host-death family protein
MTERDAPTVGVRELRQNLSVYVARVKRGEAFAVTEHGHLVARLVPARPEPMDVLDRLVAEGRAVRARGDHRTLDLPPAFPGPPLSSVLRQMRDEDQR